MSDAQRKVLLLDDDIISMMVTAGVLSKHGYNVVQTTSPHGCLARLDYEDPDVLLMDVDMPRLAVDDLLRNIKASNELKDLIVVLFSARDAEPLDELCVARDLHGYFCKSMDVTRLPEYIDYFF